MYFCVEFCAQFIKKETELVNDVTLYGKGVRLSLTWTKHLRFFAPFG